MPGTDFSSNMARRGQLLLHVKHLAAQLDRRAQQHISHRAMRKTREGTCEAIVLERGA